MRSNIQVVAHGAVDNQGPTIVLTSTDGSKHIFGHVSEGLQRVLSQNKNRMSKLRNLFITGTLNWNSVGGVPGLVLTVADQGVKSLNIYSAGANIAWACATWRHFVFRQGLDLRANSIQGDEYYSDEYLDIAGVAVGPSRSTKDSVRDVSNNSVAQKLMSKMFPAPTEPLDSCSSSKTFQSVSLPAVTADPRSSCYIIQLHPTRGRFLVAKARALGVPPGIMYGQLTEGQTVTTPDGTTVTPDQVLEPSKPGTRVLVIECPTNEYIQSVVAKDWHRELLGSTRPSKKQKTLVTSSPESDHSINIQAIYHFLGSTVNPFNGPYADWISTFPQTCQHFIYHPEYAPNGITLESSAILNSKLQSLFPENFSLPVISDPPKQWIESPNIGPLISSDICYLETTTKSFDTEIETSKDLSTLASSEISSYQVPNLSVPSDLEDPEIVCLGTGSSLPSKYRNVISTLVRTKHGSVVLDCGEATVGNMMRTYGNHAENLIKEISLLYLSHLHADHHLGIVTLIRKWSELSKDEPKSSLLLVCPGQYYEFLQEWSQLESLDLDRIRFIDNEAFLVGDGYLPDFNRRSDRGSLKLTDELDANIITCKAFHCELSYCVSIELIDKQSKRLKVAYSGDTRPNRFFANVVGKNSDILVHEATHEIGLEEEAIKKRHSTVGEAVSIGQLMKAKSIMLTHFSQRYPKLPLLTGIDFDSVPVALGFDGMRMKRRDMAQQYLKFNQLASLLEVNEETRA